MIRRFWYTYLLISTNDPRTECVSVRLILEQIENLPDFRIKNKSRKLKFSGNHRNTAVTYVIANIDKKCLLAHNRDKERGLLAPFHNESL